MCGNAFLPLYYFYTMTSDESLITSYRSGDTDAFTELYERYAKRIYTFIYFKTLHQQTAEDITSQTFMHAIEKIDTFNSNKGVFSAWIHRIARNLVIDHFRAFRPNSSLDDVWDIADATDVVADIDTLSKVESITAILATLSASQREVILLRVWHGYTFKEIATVQSSTEAACKMQYKRGMQVVKKDLVLALFLFLFSV